MPLAAPIGSGLGIRDPHNLPSSSSTRRCRCIVDAGVGTASDAAVAIELGCHGVLVNTRDRAARDAVAMAGAMREAVEAGRKAFLAGRRDALRERVEPDVESHRGTRGRDP